MPYIGRDLNRGNYLKLDDISSSFNSSTKTFNLTVGGSAFTPGSAFSILVSVGGVIQEPESAYQVNNSEITFANAPTAQDSFFCLALGVPIGIGVPGNSTVNGTQMAKPFNYDGFFYLNDSSNRVGINSSIPTASLDVIGDIKLNGSLVNSGGGGLQGNVYAASGISTFNDVRVTNNLTVEGTTTTLDTNLIGVDRIEVGANSNSIVGLAVTQSGTADILNLYDGSTEVFSVADGGAITAAGNLTISNTEPYILLQDTNNNDDFLVRNTNGVFTIRDSTNGTDRLTIDSNGVATIGKITTPDFTGTGDFTISSTVPQILLEDTNNNDDFSIRNYNGVFTVRDATNGVDRLTINSNGQVLINIAGSATPIGTTSTLRVANNGSNAGYSVFEAESAAGSIRLGNDGTFHLTGDIRLPDSIIHTGDTNTKIRFPADDTISFETAGDERLRIKNDGNVIIGTTTWQYEKPLNVQGSSGSIISLYNGDTTSYAADTYSAIELKINTGNTGNQFGALEIRGIKEEGTNGNNARALTFYTGANGGSNQEKLRIDSTGAVRINNTRTTATKLHVVGGTASGTAYDAAVFAGGQNSTSGSGVKLYLSGCENNPLSRGVILESIATTNDNAHRFSVKVGGSSAAPTERFQLAPGGQAYFFGNQTNTPNGIFGFRYDKSNDTDLSIENLSNSSVNNNAGIRLATNHSNIKFRYFNNGGFYISNASTSGYLHYYEGSDSRLYIDTSGNISINNGATPPSSNGQIGKRLGIKSTQNNIIVGETTNNGNSGLILESRVTGRSGNARSSQIDLGNSIIKFYTAASAADVTQRMQINGNGQVSISNDGTTDGILTIKGDTDQVGTPSIRLLDGSDTREVSITNTSGDFVASVHGNDNAIHGHIKLFESGIIDLNNGGAAGSNVNRLRIDVYGTTQVNSIRQRVFAPNTGSTNGYYWKIGSVTLNGSEGFILTFCGTGGYSNGQQIAGTTKVVARCSNASTLVGYRTGSSIGAQLGIEDVRWKHEGSNVFSIWAKVQHYTQITPFVDFFGGALGGWIPDSTSTGSTSAPSGSTAFSDWEYKQINGVNTIQYLPGETYFLQNIRMANGKGINFSPTTDGGSGTPSELLDDYEEGYFAPEITNLSSGYGSGTFYNRQARYTKVGNMVTCWVHIQFWGVASTSGSDNLELTITGFPFEVDGVGYSGSCGGGLQAQSWRFSGSGWNNYATTSDNVQPRINSNEQIRFGVFAHNSITGTVTQKSINGYAPNIEFVFTVRVSAYK